MVTAADIFTKEELENAKFSTLPDRCVVFDTETTGLTPRTDSILEIGAVSTPALPQEAVVQSGGKNYIFVLEESKGQHKEATTTQAVQKPKEENVHYAFRQVEVGVGATENGYTALLLPEKFDMQKKVVVKGAYDLLSKMNNSAEAQ